MAVLPHAAREARSRTGGRWRRRAGTRSAPNDSREGGTPALLAASLPSQACSASQPEGQRGAAPQRAEGEGLAQAGKVHPSTRTCAGRAARSRIMFRSRGLGGCSAGARQSWGSTSSNAEGQTEVRHATVAVAAAPPRRAAEATREARGAEAKKGGASAPRHRPTRAPGGAAMGVNGGRLPSATGAPCT